MGRARDGATRQVLYAHQSRAAATRGGRGELGATGAGYRQGAPSHVAQGISMRWLNILLARLRSLLGRDAVMQDIDEELRLHLELETQTNIERGMSVEAARQAARRSFGNVGYIKDVAYEIRGGGLMETVVQDVQFGLRMLRNQPGFALVIVLSLALGIGANTAIFSVVNAVLLNPPPFRAADRRLLS